MKNNKNRAIKFKFATRFIDDECNLNDGGEFGRSFKEIYPSNFDLKCEHDGARSCNFS